MKKIVTMLLLCIVLVSCAQKKEEKNTTETNKTEVKKEEKDNSELKILQNKFNNLEKESNELKEKLTKQEEQQKEIESVSNIIQYLQKFNEKYPEFAIATYDKSKNTVNIRLILQAACDVSGLIDHKNNGTITKPMLEGWQNEIVDIALLVSNNLDKSIKVNFLHPTEIKKTIVEVKAGKVIKDIMK
ncbi:hypothetical protein VJI77_02390 [Parvimonas sp. D2]|uniref:hypothetical protein n=1 Tax=unclassified Parvimonas TaxID=1151464 RepID=UPI002B4A834A|nr:MULTISPECIES: hypothetical protein [unclassified Parvimonas]MEB3011856.1 hypothetical protein [Parvimonas sp. D2]MEB3087348.1 hypothetical protein [Parvimonas sp. D4]